MHYNETDGSEKIFDTTLKTGKLSHFRTSENLKTDSCFRDH